MVLSEGMGMKVLVTGADGFIGSHLTEMLVAGGYDVRALALYNSFNNWGWLEEVGCKKDIEVVSGDVRDPFFCEKIMEGIDTVYHLAALIAIPYSYVAPQSYIETNVTGTLNICQAAMKHKVRRVLHTSTSEVYGTAKYVPIDEKHPLQPQSPYSASKIGADAMALSYHLSFQLPVTVVRPFNTFGPRQSMRAVIPTIIGQLAAGKKEISLGDLRPTRDFNFVKDTCAGFMSIAKHDNTIGQTLNIGTGVEVTIEETFNLIRDIMGVDARILKDDQRIRPENSEVFRLCADASALKKLTGHAPRYDLRRGLEETVKFFLDSKNLSKYKTDVYNV